MEEALWNLEDKWKLSTHKAIILFASTSVLVVGICAAVAAAALRRRRRRNGIVHQEPCKETATAEEVPAGRWSVVKALMGWVRWSKWEDRLRVAATTATPSPPAPTPLLVKRDVGWQSHNSTSAVWQRPILMGEKCELPRFSGLILYDHKGLPLHHYDQLLQNQEMSPPMVGTTLRDLL